MALSRKALNYDLDDKLLQKHYPNSKSYKNAWRDVKKFFHNEGFEDRQYSGVVSIRPMSVATVQDIIVELGETFEWLVPCVQKLDVTNIGDVHDLSYILNDNR